MPRFYIANDRYIGCYTQLHNRACRSRSSGCFGATGFTGCTHGDLCITITGAQIGNIGIIIISYCYYSNIHQAQRDSSIYVFNFNLKNIFYW